MKTGTAALIAALVSVRFVIAVPVELPEGDLYAPAMLSAGVKAIDEIIGIASKALGSTSVGNTGTSNAPKALKVKFKTFSKPSPPRVPYDVNSPSDAELLELILNRPRGNQPHHMPKLSDERILELLPPPLPSGWHTPKSTPEQIVRAKRIANIRNAIRFRKRKQAQAAAAPQAKRSGTTSRDGVRTKATREKATTKRKEEPSATATFRSLVEFLPPRIATARRSARRARAVKTAQASSDLPHPSTETRTPSDALSLLADAAHQQSLKVIGKNSRGNVAVTAFVKPLASTSPTPKEFEQKREKMFVELFDSASPPSSSSHANT